MKKRILCLDGGGIRGIISGTIVAYIEQRIQVVTGKLDARISDYFDMIAGTSTGGILTCCYLFPDKKFSAQQAVDLYVKRSKQIFDVPLLYKLKSVGGFNLADYPVVNIEKIFNEYFGVTTLSQLVKPCVITAYDISRGKIKIFNSVDANQSNIRNFYIKDVCRSTSAAPSYFVPAQIKSLYGDISNLVDGGVFANNPTMCAFAESKALFGKEELFIISIGTGRESKTYDINDVVKWGKIKWFKPSINMLMSSNSECVDYVTGKIEEVNDYIRMNPSLYNASHDMDDASDSNINNLIAAGKTYVADNMTMLNNIVDLLIGC